MNTRYLMHRIRTLERRIGGLDTANTKLRRLLYQARRDKTLHIRQNRAERILREAEQLT